MAQLDDACMPLRDWRLNMLTIIFHRKLFVVSAPDTSCLSPTQYRQISLQHIAMNQAMFSIIHNDKRCSIVIYKALCVNSVGGIFYDYAI